LENYRLAGKKAVMAGKIVRSPWLMVAATGVLFLVVAFCVDLRPVVDENFFFAASDPAFKRAKKIEERFPSQPQMILAVASRDISSANYLARIQRLTRRVEEIDAVASVKSVEVGPKSFADALASPFWSRLLIANDRKSTNVVLFMESGKDPEPAIRQLEKIVHDLDAAAQSLRRNRRTRDLGHGSNDIRDSRMTFGLSRLGGPDTIHAGRRGGLTRIGYPVILLSAISARCLGRARPCSHSWNVRGET
jgi:hypothetical protein